MKQLKLILLTITLMAASACGSKDGSTNAFNNVQNGDVCSSNYPSDLNSLISKFQRFEDLMRTDTAAAFQLAQTIEAECSSFIRKYQNTNCSAVATYHGSSATVTSSDMVKACSGL